MAREQVDIFIAGGGIAGLVAAAAFGYAGFSVLLADPAPPVTDPGDEGSDLRSTAFLQPARDLLDRIGLWADLRARATPLDALRIVDTHGWPPEIQDTRVFEASELGDDPFGWNLPNWQTRAIVLDHLQRQPNVELTFGTGFGGLLDRTGQAIVTLTDGRQIGAKLVIGADGRASAVREAVGIDVKTKRYGQKALAFSVTHALPHGNISTEIYNQGGAFTTVPLPDHQGIPASAIVWMNDGTRALALAAMPPDAFAAELNARSCGLLGPMQLATTRRVWPIVTQRALRLAAGRAALIAEAAHVLPPIGAQGLNTSLHDVAALLDLAMAASGDPGNAATLARYEKARSRDIAVRARAIDAFNRICKSGAAPVQALRGLGLRTVYDLSPVRQGIMRAGLGAPPPRRADQRS